MPATIYDTATLAGVQNNLKPIPNYFLNLLFPTVQTFDTQFIDFDIIEGGRRIAPFVAPNVQGRVMKSQGYTTRRFEPAYVKPKHVVDPTKQFKRLAGERYGGTLSPSQRYQAAVGENMRVEREMIERRWEWLAAKAILDGEVTLTGEDYEAQTITFGRDAGQTVTKGVGAKWGDAGVSIMEDIQSWVDQTQVLSGYAPDRLTVTPEAWAKMRVDTGVLAVLDTTARVGNASLDLGIQSGPEQYKGTLGANLQVWVYNDIYENDAGATERFMPAGTVLLTSSGVEGVRCFGAIMDFDNLTATEMFAKMWENQDPSVVYTMTQSAPLMVPTRPDATLLATVL